MSAATTTPDALIGPMFDTLLTPEAATRALSYTLPEPIVRRIEILREKAGEDQLTPDERREYARYVEELDVIAVVKLKARRVLASAGGGGGLVVAVSDAVRREVVRRANGRCEYCRLPVGGDERAPRTSTTSAPNSIAAGDEAANLAMTCDRCNLHKGTNLAGVDPQTGQVTPLFDPRTMVWAEHFTAVGAEVLRLTPKGRTTAELFGNERAEPGWPCASNSRRAGEWP